MFFFFFFFVRYLCNTPDWNEKCTATAIYLRLMVHFSYIDIIWLSGTASILLDDTQALDINTIYFYVIFIKWPLCDKIERREGTKNVLFSRKCNLSTLRRSKWQIIAQMFPLDELDVIWSHIWLWFWNYVFGTLSQSKIKHDFYIWNGGLTEEESENILYDLIWCLWISSKLWLHSMY